ncbi:MAG: M1 family aminopeptidase [Vicinamibacterales bacterium]
MNIRGLLGAGVVAAVVTSGPVSCVAAPVVGLEASQAPAAANPQPSAPTQSDLDDDATLRLFLQKLEPIILAADVDAFAALEGPLGSRDEAVAFATAELSTGATRVVVQERDRSTLSLNGIPGNVYALTVDAFIEFGNRARVATWQLFVRRSGDSWALIRQQVVSSVDNLFRLTMNSTKQFDIRNLAINAEDLQLTIVDGTAFSIDTERGVTGLVVMGRGDMRFSPGPETEKGQVRIFTGSEVLETRFDAAFIRVGTPDLHYDGAALIERAVDPRALKRAQQIFADESPKSFAVDLADLTRDAWTLLPGSDDFLAEVRTKRFDTLTYARSASEPEDISLFERRRKRNIAIYASKEKLASRGRFYNEDDLTPIDVLDYDIDVTSLPDRQWIDGRARMRLKARTSAVGQLTIKLADSLNVRSLTSDRFGRLFYLRVTNQNTLLINLPALLDENDELTLTVSYAGRLEPQSPDRETLALGQDDGFGSPGSAQPSFPDDISIPRAEPSFLYSNRSFWYPQSTVSDYATARIRISVPIFYGCVATGEASGPPQVQMEKDPLNARHIYVFDARRPARYLSFIVSRFVPVDRTDIVFSPGVSAEGSQDAGIATSAQIMSAEPLPSLRLSVDANPRQTREAKRALTRAESIIKFYQSLIGDTPYPSFTIALVENLTPGGHSPPYFAQLNEPLPNSPLTWRNDPAAFEDYPEFFMAHEIAHQWWGHGVGWQNYHEQWISEGFAQYFAALYANDARGTDVFQGILKRMRRWAMNESAQGPVHLGYRVGHIRNNGRAFRAIVYNKGAMVLHMLRQYVGDEVFFGGVRRFYLSSRFHKVGTEDFRLAMEAESGLDLKRFFERWIYNATLPQVSFAYRVERAATGQVAVLRFEQTGELFDFPVLVTLTSVDGRSRDVLVKVADRVTEMRVPVDAPLKSASISRKDVALADIRTATAR